MAKAKSFDIKNVNVELVDSEKAKKPEVQYRDPYWSNKEHRHLIVQALYPNNERRIVSIMDKDGTNPDMKKILEVFTEEEIDKNTEESLKRRNDNVKRSMERREAEASRAKQESLFASKLEAFEIEGIKNSKNSEFKRLIRKSKSPMEVAAFAAILLGKEREIDPLVKAKMDALEIPEIKASKDPLKKRLHSAESLAEVVIFSSMILQKELDNAKA